MQRNPFAVTLSILASVLCGCSEPEPARETFDTEEAVTPPAVATRSLTERKAACDLELEEQRRIFQRFVWLEDVNKLEGRKRTLEVIAKSEGLTAGCVDLIASNAVNYHPDWVPDPL